MIGKGRLGSNLSYWLKRVGLDEIYSFSANLSDFFQTPFSQMQNYLNHAKVIFIASSESKFSLIVEHLKNYNLKGKIVVHLANALNSMELSALKKKGAFIASFSPLQTFPFLDRKSSPFKNCYFLFEGDNDARETLESICLSLKSRLFPVSAELKPLFHLVAVITSNHLIALLKFAENQLKKISSPNKNLEIFWPLIERTIKNARRRGISAAISGPATRGESQIITKHLSLLDNSEKELYKMLSALLNVQVTKT